MNLNRVKIEFKTRLETVMKKDKEAITLEMIRRGYGLPHTDWDRIWKKDKSLKEIKRYRDYLNGVIEILEE